MPPVTQSKLSAFHCPEVRVVEASAGSGKTYALAKRYVQLLLKEAYSADQPMRHVLAITFTNKAALEMKERILSFLKRVALKDFPAGEAHEILGPVGLDADEASRRAFFLMESLLRHYNFFQVQTIDSFINAMLSGCAFKLGLSAGFKIRSHYQDYLEYSLDELIDSAPRQRPVRRMFEGFLNNYLYLENRSGWFPKKDLLAIVRDLYCQGNYYAQGFRPSPFSREEIIARKKNVLSDLKELRKILPEKTHKGFVKELEGFLHPQRESFDVDELSDYLAREEVPVNKGEAVPDEAVRLWRSVARNLQELCEAEAFSMFNPYIEILSGVMANLRRQAAKDDILFLQEMNKQARALFDEERVTVEELYYRLATRLRHYLIDEFQDTSRLNWQNMEMMVEEALATGGTLFYVGDKKQAIYNFRGGDTALFDELKTRFPNCPVTDEPLSKNWRSHQVIVDFNNRIFAMDNLQRFLKDVEKKSKEVVFDEQDLRRVESVFARSQQTGPPQKPGGYVRVERFESNNKEDRDEEIRLRLLSLVRELRQRYSLKDMAVLTRSNREVEEVTGWLLAEGLAVDSERTSDIRTHPLILELVELLKFLDSPIDNMAFVRFLLGDIFTTASGLDGETLRGFIFSLRERLRNEKDFYVYREFREKYPQAWGNLFEEFFKNVGLYPLYELTVSIYHRYRVVERFPGAQGFFMHFLELIKRQEEECADVADFLKYFEENQSEDFYVPVAGEEMIEVLTIHKAKGLEFPVVILPFLGMDVQVGSKSDDNKFSYILRPGEQELYLLRLKKKYGAFSEKLRRLYDDEYKRSLLAELNAVYVALTRACGELYIFLPSKCGRSHNLLQNLIPTEWAEAGTPPETGAAVLKEEAGLLYLPPSSYYNWLEYLRDEFVSSGEIKHQHKRREGQILHFLLSQVGNLSRRNRDEEVEKAVRAAGVEFVLGDEIKELRQRLEAIVGSPALQDFFFNGDAEVFTEKELVTSAGDGKRIDRLVISGEEVWVVDYKLAHEKEGRYIQQVAEYMELIKSLHPMHAVKGFLVYLDSFTYEEVSG